MSRLNTSSTSGVGALRTHEGAVAHRIGAEAQLRRSVMACLLWEDTFYESGEDIAAGIANEVAEVSLEAASKIAIEARNLMHLRHVPLLVAREMAYQGGHWISDTLAEIIQRPDELGEFLAIYWKDGRCPLSKQVKLGLAEAFSKFDAYQLAKYDREGAIRLRDVMFLTHPKPKDSEQATTWKALVDGTLPSPDTWEVALSSGKDKKETWERLLNEQKLGGLALLRNLRNMQAAGVSENLIAEAIRSNPFKRVLPFRFLAAAKYAPTLEPELEAAMFRSTVELPKLPGRTALLVDRSGSMFGAPLSSKSDLDRIDAACALAVLLREVCQDVLVIAFGTRPEIIPPRRGFALRDAIHAANTGGSTNTDSAKQIADAKGYDRIIIITDEQSHQNLSNPNGLGYVINVAAYKNGVGYGAWTHIDGFSENVVRYIQAREAFDEA